MTKDSAEPLPSKKKVSGLQNRTNKNSYNDVQKNVWEANKTRFIKYPK